MNMTRTDVQTALAQIKMGKGISSSAGLMLAVMKPDGRMRVKKFIETYPGTESAAQQALGGLIKDLKKKLDGNVEVVRTRKNSPEGAWVRFERIAAETADLPKAKVTDFEKLGPRYQNRVAQKTDPIVLMTFNKRESQAVLECFCPDEKPMGRPEGSITVFPLMVVNGAEVLLTVSGQGPRLSANYARTVFNALHPQAIIGVGCAFGTGLPEQELGHVLVAEEVYDYQLMRINKDGSWEARGEAVGHPWQGLLDNIRNIDQVSRHTVSGIPPICAGPILSGGTLIDQRQYRDRIARQTGRIVTSFGEGSEIISTVSPGRAVGGDMEALGLALESQALLNERKVMQWGVVKGISDWADGSKKDPEGAEGTGRRTREHLLQYEPATNAARIVYYALTGEMPPVGKPRRRGKEGTTQEDQTAWSIPDPNTSNDLGLVKHRLDLKVSNFELDSGAPATPFMGGEDSA